MVPEIGLKVPRHGGHVTGAEVVETSAFFETSFDIHGQTTRDGRAGMSFTALV